MTDYEKRFWISLFLFFLLPPVWLIYKLSRLVYILIYGKDD